MADITLGLQSARLRGVRIGLTVVGGVVAVWISFVIVLWTGGRDTAALTMAGRPLPDIVRLVGRLARDRTVPRSARWQLRPLLACLASPVDLVPDFLLVLGYADDAILASLVLRRLIRRSDPDALAGTGLGQSGLATHRRVVRLRYPGFELIP